MNLDFVGSSQCPTVLPDQHENLQCFQCFITFCSAKAKERHMKKSHREEYKQQLQQVNNAFYSFFFPSDILTWESHEYREEFIVDALYSCIRKKSLLVDSIVWDKLVLLTSFQGNTLFTCYVCDRTFLSSEELTQHQPTHSKDDKPFKCVHCKESFKTFSEVSITTNTGNICIQCCY